MRHLVLIVLLVLGAVGVQAQAAAPKLGDPPVLSRVNISPPDNSGLVKITGSNGAVFPNAYVTIRNMYTGDTVYVRAGGTGNFNAQIYGPGNTPFWISPTDQYIPPEQQNIPGSLPGGPGAILYGMFPDTPPSSTPVTKIAIDGEVSDWSAYSSSPIVQANTHTLYALHNADSLYLAFSGDYLSTPYTKIEIRFTVDLATYALTFDPVKSQAADLARVNPAARDLGTLIIAARQASALEVRIPLSFVVRANHVVVNAVQWFDASGTEVRSETLSQELPALGEIDGVFRSHSSLGQNVTRFSLAGPVSSGATWSAHGRVDALKFDPGATWHIEMDLDYGATDLPADAQFVGQISLQPIARSVDGQMRTVGGVLTNNGWSSILTDSGLPIDNLNSSISLGEAVARPFQLIRGQNDIRFPLDFSLELPPDLPTGLYVPEFRGYIQAADGTRTPWETNASALAHLPLVLNIGQVQQVHLPWVLFADSPSNGSRGILPDEDRATMGLSNRVRFNSPLYILPPFQPDTQTPISYPLEPYLLNQLANRYDITAAPLIPFEFPGGQLQAQVTRPDGVIDDLGSTGILQNQLSTPTQDERTLFGAQSPVDEYRLATLAPKYQDYQFTQYGEYTIKLTGTLQDVWGNQYDGGGTYHVLAAEPLDLRPGALSGTPFEIGNVFNFGVHLAPAVPAAVTVDLRIYPLDGSPMIEKKVQGQADRYGNFQPGDVFVFNTPGEYVVDYQARYSDANNRLWAASTRGAGVIASPQHDIVLHGERGLPGVNADWRPAWFDSNQYAQAAGITPSNRRLNFPYQSGDVAWVPDSSDGGIVPQIRIQDRSGAFSSWLSDALPNYVSDLGLSLPQLNTQGELPLFLLSHGSNAALEPNQIESDSYTYVSAVRPNVTVRQYVNGGEDGGLPLYWDENDPLNQQIGAGIGGDRPDDAIFLFGGAVIRSPAAKVSETAIYGALAVVTSADQTPRIYPPDRGAAGGGDGGPLMTIKDQPVDMFFDMTGVQPGEVVTQGSTVVFAGQVAPPMDAQVSVTVTAPSGKGYLFTGRANAVGYFYDPQAHLTVDEQGVWSVEVQVQDDKPTSAGQVAPPLPSGGVIGATNRRFSIYVVPEGVDPLPWNPLLTDTIIPVISPYNFSFTLPTTWTNTHAYYTLSMPGYIIEDGPIRVNGRSFSYQYTTLLQNRAFPNLESEGRPSGAYVADTRTLTFVATGVDENGQFQIRSRTFTVMHDRLISME